MYIEQWFSPDGTEWAWENGELIIVERELSSEGMSVDEALDELMHFWEA